MIDKQQVVDLWQECFNDSEAFVRLYFSTKYTEENSLVHIENEKLLSALQMLPYSMTCWGRELRISYISGASTRPEARGRGLMKDLLTEAFRVMRSRDVHFSTLIPAESWLFDFYRRLGYGTVFYSCMKNYEVTPIKKYPLSHSYSEEELYAYFMISMEKRPCCIQHSFQDFQIILADLYLAGGKVFAVSGDRGHIGGLALVVPDSGKVWIKEWMYDNDEMKKKLLFEIESLYPRHEIVSIIPVSHEEGTPFGMMRIIDASMILQYYAAAYPEIDMTISLRDEQIPSNTATYILEKGFCKKKPFQCDNAGFIFSPAKLVERIFSNKSCPVPCMSLMLN